MSIHKNHKRKPLTRSQTYDVWEVADVEDITEEVEKVMRSMDLETDEIKMVINRPRGGKRGRSIK